ncbi:MAG TPA: C4-dicarboxylate transporter DctA [Kofleriaceae bacterium]|nr:C4-dicarboxylate transporter DctA [Kofleriaceae bacterium]
MATRRFYATLYFRVLVGIALGIAVGLAAPDLGAQLKPLADGFIRLVTMTIAPLIFCTVVVGIAGMTSMKEVGKAGGLALVYFEVVTTIALAIGLVIVNVVSPGSGMNHALSAKDLADIDAVRESKEATNWVLDIIPELGGKHLLGVLLVAILFAFALHRLGERGKPLVESIDRIGRVVFNVIAIIMELAPIGAFGAMAYTVGKFGGDSLEYLGKLMACFYATCLVFIFGVLGTIARVHGFSIFRFLRYIRHELLVVLGTSSSESVLPRMMDKLETAGAGKPVVGLVVPAGYSFNLDGTAIYVTMGAMFAAQATNTPLSLAQQIALLGVAMLASKGAAGVTGAGFITLVVTLDAFGHIPVGALAIIFGIDRFMSEARALTNVIGNGVATLVVARWCGDLDRDKLAAALDPAQKQQESR